MVSQLAQFLVRTSPRSFNNRHKILTCKIKPVINRIIALNFMQLFVIKLARSDINLPYNVAKLKAIAGVRCKSRYFKLVFNRFCKFVANGIVTVIYKNNLWLLLASQERSIFLSAWPLMPCIFSIFALICTSSPKRLTLLAPSIIFLPSVPSA